MQTRISDDPSSQRLEELQQAINELSRVIEGGGRERRKRAPTLIFPFSLLAWAITSGLEALNQAIGRLVKRIIR
jgi:hypothetical protein